MYMKLTNRNIISIIIGVNINRVNIPFDRLNFNLSFILSVHILIALVIAKLETKTSLG